MPKLAFMGWKSGEGVRTWRFQRPQYGLPAEIRFFLAAQALKRPMAATMPLGGGLHVSLHAGQLPGKAESGWPESA